MTFDACAVRTDRCLKLALTVFWYLSPIFCSPRVKMQGNYAAYAALGFSKHLGGDVDGAIDSYHEALSRKPEDPFTSEMLLRALSEAVTYPPSLAMLSSLPPGEEVSFGGIGGSIMKKMGGSSGSGRSVPLSDNDQDMSMFASDASDVDMSLT